MTPTGDAAETFTINGGTAGWKSPIDAGTARYSAPAFYVSQGGPIDTTAWFLEALLARPDKSLDLLPGGKARAAKLNPKATLKADKDGGRIVLDSETTLSGVPPEAWEYKLGNRSALEWILDQYKEKKPKDPTIREKFDTYRFANYKEKVIDLLLRVTTVSMETVAIVEQMKATARG